MVRVWVSDREFPSKQAVIEECRRIIAKYPDDGDPTAAPAGSRRITDSDDEAFMLDVVAWNPEFEQKVGVGVDHLEVRYLDYGTRSTCIVRPDGTWKDVSWREAIKNLPTSPPG